MSFFSDLPITVQQRLKHIRLLIMDVDGTLTDGSMYYGENGEMMKRFFVRDGMAIARLPTFGIQTCFMTAEKNGIVMSRATRLHISHCVLGTRTKKSDLLTLTKKIGIETSEVAYIGDDINDELAMSICGLSFCPNDAHPIILQKVDYIVPYPGGRGAARAVCDMILHAQGHPLTLDETW